MCSKGIYGQVPIDVLTKFDRHLDQHSTNILLDTSTLDQVDSWVTCINQKLIDSRLTDSQVSTEVSIRVNRGVTSHLTTMEFRHQPTHHQAKSTRHQTQIKCWHELVCQGKLAVQMKFFTCLYANYNVNMLTRLSVPLLRKLQSSVHASMFV